MPLTVDLSPTNPPPPVALLSNPNLTKLCMSISCPELKGESENSSSDEEDGSIDERFKRFESRIDPPNESLRNAPLSMDASEAIIEPPSAILEQAVIQPCLSPISSTTACEPRFTPRRKLQWVFKGLTLFLELEEFNNDLTRAVEDFSSKHSSPFIPKPHTTAIYGMDHLSVGEARALLHQVRRTIGDWPTFAKPTGVTSDIAVCGRPGQVCSIAWSELTLASNPSHEDALDALHRLFFGENWCADARDRPWKPHNSMAYDNPDTNTLSLLDTIGYVSKKPTLLELERRVEAISLWSTEGKMEEWFCIDRVRFW